MVRLSQFWSRGNGAGHESTAAHQTVEAVEPDGDPGTFFSAWIDVFPRAAVLVRRGVGGQGWKSESDKSYV